MNSPPRIVRLLRCTSSRGIVKGGQQDRVLTTDLILPPYSGKVPISAFCVEQGRWSKRGSESATQFGLSDKAVAFKSLKSAVHDPNAQGKVWDEVAKARADLAVTVPPNAGSGGGTGSGSGAGIGPGVTGGPAPARPALSASIVAPASTSMQIAMESRTVTSAAEGYRKSLEGIIANQDDVVGFVYAVNGEINSAEVYASPDLFRRMWPKLLESAATEAVAARGKGAKSAQPNVADAKGLLRDGDAAREVSRQSTGRLSVARKESAKVLLFDTTDSQANGNWLHRSYLVKYTNSLCSLEHIERTVKTILELRIPKLVITVSLDGYKELHDRLRGVPNNFDKAIAVFKMLKVLRKEHRNLDFVFGYTMSKYNKGAFEKTFEEVKSAIPGISYNDFHINLAQSSDNYYRNKGADIGDGRDLASELESILSHKSFAPSAVSILDTLFLKKLVYFARTGKSPMRNRSLELSLFMDSGGDIYPSIVSNIKVGNIKDADFTLMNILDNDVAIHARDSIRNGGEPPNWTSCEAYQVMLGNLLGSLF